MQRHSFKTHVWILAVLVVLSCGALDSLAQAPRRAPTRVNTASIRTATGGALLQAIRPRESATSYRGGFLHIYPGHNIQQAPQNGSVEYAQFAQDQMPESDLLPPLPGGGGEDVMGIMDPSVDEPVFADSPAIPADGYLAAECGPCQNAKGKYGKGKHGKGGHGHFGFHEWNWACFCVPMPPEDNPSVNFGAHGFKGPLNVGMDGSFGFHEGFNLGAALPGCSLGIGWQIGVQGVHSNFPGQGIVSGSDRNQLFFTWGFFRRVDHGLQGGFVFDHLEDDFILDNRLDQVRGEISWVLHGCSEFGVMFNFSDERAGGEFDIEIADLEIEAELSIAATDLVAFFYRHHFGCCRESWGRIYIGATESRGSLARVLELDDNGNDEFEDVETHSAVVFGADMHVNLSDCWALETGFTWLSAGSDDRAGAFEDSWNVGFNMIWTPRGHCCGTTRGYYRPLFNVADNGTFLTHLRGDTGVELD